MLIEALYAPVLAELPSGFSGKESQLFSARSSAIMHSARLILFPQSLPHRVMRNHQAAIVRFLREEAKVFSFTNRLADPASTLWYHFSVLPVPAQQVGQRVLGADKVGVAIGAVASQGEEKHPQVQRQLLR